FRDMTRVAAGHPGIWPDICAENREAIVATLDRLVGALTSMRDVVSGADREGLLRLLERARDARVSLPVRAARAEDLVELRVPVPGSKSLTNRALLLAALAEGTSALEGVLVADDTEAMIDATGTLGAEVLINGDRATVTGCGGVLRPGPLTFHAREAGTVARF